MQNKRRERQLDSSFTGHGALDAHFGLGNADEVDELTIIWPSGSRQVVKDVKKNQVIKVVEK
jgi:enediyne biosynthesis protein E4